MKLKKLLYLTISIAAYAMPLMGQEPETPPENFGDSHFISELVNMILTLGLIIALLVGITWLMKKTQMARVSTANAGSSIKIVDQRPLSSKSCLYLIRVSNKVLLIAETATGITSLGDVSMDHDKTFEKILDSKENN